MHQTDERPVSLDAGGQTVFSAMVKLKIKRSDRVNKQDSALHCFLTENHGNSMQKEMSHWVRLHQRQLLKPTLRRKAYS